MINTYFFQSKEELLRGLHAIQKLSCDYVRHPGKDSSTLCDCKYGIADLLEKAQQNDEKCSGKNNAVGNLRGRMTGWEQTGCPELVEAICIIAALTDREFEVAAKRVKDKRVIVTESCEVIRNGKEEARERQRQELLCQLGADKPEGMGDFQHMGVRELKRVLKQRKASV